jgi:hypothetical protein
MQRATQTAGCCGILSDCRLRVAAVVRNYGLTIAAMKRQPTAANCTMCFDHPGNIGSDRFPKDVAPFNPSAPRGHNALAA